MGVPFVFKLCSREAVVYWWRCIRLICVVDFVDGTSNSESEEGTRECVQITHEAPQGGRQTQTHRLRREAWIRKGMHTHTHTHTHTQSTNCHTCNDSVGSD